MENDKLVCIKKYLHRHEAHIAKGLLDSNDIRCYIAGDDAGGARPYQSYITPLRLMVMKEDADKAIDLLGKDS